MSLQDKLIAAIPSNDIDKIKKLLDKGTDINYVYKPRNITALIYAIHKADDKTVEFLLRNGANPNYDPLQGNGMYTARALTPLLRCIFLEKTSTLKILLKNGADANFMPSHGMTPIKYAILVDNQECLQILIDNKADINLLDKDNKTPLEFAIVENKKDIAHMLIKNDADLRKDIDGKKVYYSSSNKEMQKLLNMYIQLDRLLRKKQRTQDLLSEEEEKVRYKKALSFFDDIIGLDAVKKNVEEIINDIKIQKLRDSTKKISAGHYVFQGNPGTGKTTIARLMDDVFKELGVLEDGHLVEVTREDLVGEHIGETALNTKLKLTEALGGILFIDEAYSLVGEGNDFGKEAINTIVPFMENHKDDFVLIVAGYSDDMADFLNENTGLKSRFTNVIEFEDYDNKEMVQIFNIFMKEEKLTMDKDLEELLSKIFDNIRKKSKHFGNAREARKLFQAIKTAMSNRLVKLRKLKKGDKRLYKMTIEDIPQRYLNLATGSYKEISKKNIDEALSNLKDVVGLDSVKENISDIINHLKLAKRRKKTDFASAGHFIFHGNPGTGKTMVANIMDDILTSLGILEHGRMVEVTRKDLVGKYIGETVEKTTKVLESALGGVLFIDEAYSLSKGGEKDFGKEAIDTIVPFMEKHREDFVLIVAGYEKEMKEFLDANTGLKSRFNHTIHFEDYKDTEMLEIFKKFVQADKYLLEDGVDASLKSIFNLMYSKAEHFGNGRDARKLYNQVCRNMDKRLVQDESITGDALNRILQEDLMDIKIY